MIDHIQGTLDAMTARNADALAEHLSEQIVMRSPLLPEPFVGKTTVLGVLGSLLGLIDRFEAERIMRDGDHGATAFHFVAGDAHIDGMDYVTLDASGRISSLSVLWRPLPEIVKMQNRIAPVLGIPPLSLVAHET